MSTADARPTLHDVGYRRAILLLGAFWGASPALSFGITAVGSLTPTQGWVAIGTVMTLSLGALYELDSRKLDEHGDGIPLAWSYALVAPISVVAWSVLGPGLAQIPGLGLLGILAGPPVSALLYVWQRGRHASVA